MIGIVAADRYQEVISEFFELFKTPWEFYQAGRTYDVVLCNEKSLPECEAGLRILFAATNIERDPAESLKSGNLKSNLILEGNGFSFPLYGTAVGFKKLDRPLIETASNGDAVGIRINNHHESLIRLGFDLFGEIEFILKNGQPFQFASMPAIDIYIALLRSWILDAGLSLIEIPSAPAGFEFITCLTHDVDFINLRDHGIDRTLAGFALRAIFPRHIRNRNHQIAYRRVWKNWKALFSLPLAWLGLGPDPWFDMERYQEIEAGKKSTFYFLPFKDDPGVSQPYKPAPSIRAAKYDVRNYFNLLQKLKNGGFEIGVHGIDAWHDERKGVQERNAVADTVGNNTGGIRMHWLYYDENSPQKLEKAGFLYDSTLGYNEAVGFKSGTARVFKPLGDTALFELPLTIMDTALFYPDRLNLTEADAFDQCLRLIDQVKRHNGVLTINWHTRSLSPERNWDEFYLELLDVLKNENTWFASARDAVNWYAMRRTLEFKVGQGDLGFVQKKDNLNKNCPGFILRIYDHAPGLTGSFPERLSFRDIILTSSSENIFPVDFKHLQ